MATMTETTDPAATNTAAAARAEYRQLLMKLLAAAQMYGRAYDNLVVFHEGLGAARADLPYPFMPGGPWHEFRWLGYKASGPWAEAIAKLETTIAGLA